MIPKIIVAGMLWFSMLGLASPRLDAIAVSSMILTDAHSGSSVCTPPRYGLIADRASRHALCTEWVYDQSGIACVGVELLCTHTVQSETVETFYRIELEH